MRHTSLEVLGKSDPRASLTRSLRYPSEGLFTSSNPPEITYCPRINLGLQYLAGYPKVSTVPMRH